MKKTKINLIDDFVAQSTGETITLSGETKIKGTFKIDNNGEFFLLNSTPGVNKVLISDNNGKGTWGDYTGNTFQIKRPDGWVAVSGQTDFVINGAVDNEIEDILSLTVGNALQDKSQYSIENTNVTRDTIRLTYPLQGDEDVYVEYFTQAGQLNVVDKNLNIDTITASTYTLKDVDNGSMLRFTNTTTIILPNGFTSGYNVGIFNAGSGTLTLSATTLHVKGGYTKITEQYASATIWNNGSDIWEGIGDIIS